MRRIIISFFLVVGIFSFGQNSIDSVFVKLSFAPDLRSVHVEQKIILQQSIKVNYFDFHAYANAYENRNTALSKQMLAYRNDRLHFAPLESRGGIRDLKIYNESGDSLQFHWLHEEKLRINLSQTADHRAIFNLLYRVDLPSHRFTGYGVSTDEKARLKYFFIHPVSSSQKVLEHYLGLDILQSSATFHYLEIENKDVYSYADIPQVEKNIFMGTAMYYPEIIVSKNEFDNDVYTQLGSVKRAYPDTGHTHEVYKHTSTNNVLNFLEEFYPNWPKQIMLSREFVRSNYLDGIDDIELPLRRRIRIFPEVVRADLEQITPINQKLADENLAVDMQNEHWLRNGLAEYIHHKFLKEKHPESLVVGQLPEQIRFLGIRPLNFFHAASIPLHQRNHLMYRYFQLQRLDEPINTPFSELGKMNQLTISRYKSGLAFEFLSAYVGKETFESHLSSFIADHQLQQASADVFLNDLESKTNKDLDWFRQEILPGKRKKEYKIQSVKKMGQSLQVKIRNQNQSKIPILFTAKSKDKTILEKWIENPQKTTYVSIPDGDYTEFSLNEDLHIDEIKIYNNYYRPGKLFNRKLKVGFFGDTESVEHYQLFMIPGLGWNLYDQWQIGLTVTNETVMPQDLSWRITPAYSTGTGTLTGGGGVRYNWYTDGSLIRKISQQFGAVYRHYDRDLAFSKWVVATTFEFQRRPSDLVYKSMSLGYEQIRRDIAADATAEEIKLQNYNLLQARFNFWRTEILDERRANINYQHSNHFNKIFAETFHRVKVAPNRIIGFRLFAGYFLTHNIRESQFFDFGLDRISDYTFSYNLLGRSESEGLFTQQFVIAEGAFKSNFHVFANQLMATTNIEYPLWSLMDLYADAGIYKNYGDNLQFVYGTGVRLRVIPDFLEFYLPIQSSLGFEPTLPDYHKRIRFMFNFNLSRVIAFWRRGKF